MIRKSQLSVGLPVCLLPVCDCNVTGCLLLLSPWLHWQYPGTVNQDPRFLSQVAFARYFVPAMGKVTNTMLRYHRCSLRGESSFRLCLTVCRVQGRMPITLLMGTACCSWTRCKSSLDFGLCLILFLLGFHNGLSGSSSIKTFGYPSPEEKSPLWGKCQDTVSQWLQTAARASDRLSFCPFCSLLFIFKIPVLEKKKKKKKKKDEYIRG